MRTVKVQEAKTHLSALLAEVEEGAEIVLARGDSPVAKLVPLRTPRRRLGFLSLHVDDSAFDPLTEDELADWGL